MNCELVDNTLYLPFGTSFSIKKQRGVNKQCRLVNGYKQNNFIAIFDENDVNFEICCDNRVCDRGIGLDLVINNITVGRPVIRPHSMRTLKHYGYGVVKKFHLISENTEKGRAMVEQTAHEYRSSYEFASMICAKIEFRVQVERCLNKVTNLPLNTIDICLINPVGKKVCAIIDIISADKEISVVFGSNNSVRELKMIINKCIGLPMEQQQIVYDGNRLTDSRKLSYYKITNGSILYLYPLFRGGGDLPSNNSWQSTQSYVSLEKIDEFDYWEDGKKKNSSKSQLFSGERGIICSGRTRKVVENIYDIIRDPNIEVNSFVIEFRMESKYEQMEPEMLLPII